MDKGKKEIINYLIIGGLTTIISLGTKYLLLFTVFNAKNSIQLQITIVISWIAAVLFAYITNRKFVFKSKEKQIRKEMMKFFGARVTTLAIETILMWLFVTLLQWNSNREVIIITIVIQILIVIGNYIISKWFVFKKKGDL